MIGKIIALWREFGCWSRDIAPALFNFDPHDLQFFTIYIHLPNVSRFFVTPYVLVELLFFFFLNDTYYISDHITPKSIKPCCNHSVLSPFLFHRIIIMLQLILQQFRDLQWIMRFGFGICFGYNGVMISFFLSLSWLLLFKIETLINKNA